MQIETSLRYYLILSRLAKMTEKESVNVGGDMAKLGHLMYCCWSCELIQEFWMAIWNYAQRALKVSLPFDTVIPLLGL